MRLPAFRPNVFYPKLKTQQMARVAAATLLAASLLVACSQQSTAPQPSAPAQAAAPAQLDAGPVLNAMLEPASDDAVDQALGALPSPTSVATTTVRSLHSPSQLDSIETWQYPGASVEVYVVSGSGQSYLKSVRVGNAGTTFHGLRVGMAAGEARAALGDRAPLLREGQDETYLLAAPQAPPIQVTLHLDHGELEAYTVHGYLD